MLSINIRQKVKGTSFNLLFPLIVALSVGPAAGLAGSIMVSRHMALVGDALSHVALPGLALGLIFNFNPFLGAFLFVAVAIIATWYIELRTTLAVEAIIGVMFVLALAIGVLITPEPDLLEALFGDISSVTLTDALLTAVLSALVIFVLLKLYPKITLSQISREIAVSTGMNVPLINLIFLLTVALVVSLGIKEVGTLLVGAVVIVPAAAARNISKSLRAYAVVSVVLGGVSAVSGVLLSVVVSLPAGPLVVIAGTAMFVLTFFLARTRK